MSEMQSNQQPQNQQNWNMPTMNMGVPPAAMWMNNPWLFYGMNNPQMQGRGMNPWFGNIQPSENQNSKNQQPTNQNQEQQKTANNRSTIPCGIVESQKDIRPADIPMDDGFGLFMRKDLEEIYIKQWGDDGKINTRRYIPVVEEIPENTESPLSNVLVEINQRFETLEKAIASLAHSSNLDGIKRSSPNQKNLKKSEVEINE